MCEHKNLVYCHNILIKKIKICMIILMQNTRDCVGIEKKVFTLHVFGFQFYIVHG